MPIDKDEWQAGRKWEALEARILTFLKNEPDKAFKDIEIYNGLGYQFMSDIWGVISGMATLGIIQTALENLVKEGSVKAKIIKEAIGEETYYMT